MNLSQMTVTPEPDRFGVWVALRALASDGREYGLRTFVLDHPAEGRDVRIAKAGARMTLKVSAAIAEVDWELFTALRDVETTE